MAVFLRALLILVAAIMMAADSAPRGSQPQYDSEGRLLRPRNFRKWVAVGSSLGLSYAEGAPKTEPGSFQNVYLEPSAYERYRRSGSFPDGTMLALVIHEPRQKQSIAQGGYFQGAFSRLEVAVKDSSRSGASWAYYDFGAAGALYDSAEPFPQDRCYACHSKHAQQDNVFVQFYPILRDGPGDE